ncbi:MAG: SGNH/GDSL hydrolase family protein [Gemmatimonadaceae bacterium]
MIRSLVRAAGALTIAGVALSCDHEAEVFMPEPADDLFRSYVAIGNSITAGVQADGINNATQRQSYAFLLAQQMRTRFAYPALAGRGCTPPIINWQTGQRFGTGSTSTTCDLRDAAVATDILNNVGVPGASSNEVHSLESPNHNVLTTLFLGGKTQVERALEANPSFVTIWLSGNDAFQAAATGVIVPTPNVSRGLTPIPTFIANYDRMLADLTAGAPGVKGVLISTVQTASAPLLFPVAAFENPAFLQGFSTAAGGPVTVHPNCVGSGALVSFVILGRMASGAHPRTIVCEPTAPASVGDIFILDATEQATVRTHVDAYNAHVQAKATELDFAYVDPNVVLGQFKSEGCATVFPNLAAAATASAFGPCVSLDGVHPSPTGQARMANTIITAINAKYGTSLAPVTVP